MARKGECLDNAVAESFFGTLKNELVYHEDYHSRTKARQSIFEYIEIFYNRQRRLAYLNFLTPVDCEAKHAINYTVRFFGGTSDPFGSPLALVLLVDG